MMMSRLGAWASRIRSSRPQYTQHSSPVSHPTAVAAPTVRPDGLQREVSVSHPNAVLAPTHTNGTSGEGRMRGVERNSPRAVPAPTVTRHAPHTVLAPPARAGGGLRAWWNDRFGPVEERRKNSPRAVPAPTVTKHAPRPAEAEPVPPLASAALQAVRAWFADRFDAGSRFGRLE